MRPIIRYLAIAFAGYVAVSILLILPALNILTPRLVHDSIGRVLHRDIILFNPFTLTVEIRNAALLEPDGEVFLSADRALVNLSLESIWSRGLVFDAVAVDSLYLHIIRLTDASFNFSDMMGGDDTQAQQPGGELPALTIHQLALHSDQIKFTDKTHRDPFSTHWDGMAVSVHDLSTVLEEGRPYTLDVVAESGGRLHWEGVVSVPGAYSEGKLELEKLSLHPLWRFAQDWVAFELKDGKLGVSGDYRLDWGDQFAYQLSNGIITLGDIDIQPTDLNALPDTAIGLSSLELRGIEVDGPGQRVGVATVDISGVDIQGFSEGDEVSLASLFAVALPEGGEVDDAGDEDGWNVSLPRIRLNDSRLRWRSQYTSPPVIEISPFALELTDLRWPPVDETHVDLSLTINGVTTLAVNGGIALDSGEGEMQYLLENLQLSMLNANIPAAFNAHITQGELGVEGVLSLLDFAPDRVQMNGSATHFSGIIEDDENALTSWDAVRWQGLDLKLAQRSIALKTLNLNGYSGRLHIYEDGSINAQRVLQAEVEEALEEGTLEEEKLRAWTFDVPSIFITDSQLNFMDESLPIDFRALIGDLNGHISGLSSSEQGEATVELKGSLDGYAPVVLAGTLRPFAEKPFIDLGLSFDGVDLVRLTPYSGTYAGYAIDRGILNLDLHYALDDNRLNGENSVVIQQLKLGEKIDSDKAVDLPLELALALLTDMNGVIDMDVPVSGDLDDPAFGLGSVIFSALGNFISKAVTAPFALLASLVGSEEDMQRIAFPSGSSELDEAAIAKLTQLTEAMNQRPGLNLVLLGRLHPSADPERLQKNLLNQTLQAAGLSAQEIGSKGELWAGAIQARYKRLPGGGTDEVSMHEQYQQVVASMPVSDQQLKDLAEERAVSVKRYLVNELQFPAERSAIELVDVDDEKNVFSGVELGVDI